MAHQKQHLASDPPRAGGSLSAVRAHVHEYAPRAPRHRPTIARRLETDLPLLVMAASAFRSAARCGLAVCGACSRPNAEWRGEVVRFGRSKPSEKWSPSASTQVTGLCNRTWAELMRRGLEIDVLECPECGGRIRFVAAIMLASAIRRILRHLGLPSDPVELAPARAPPKLDDAWAC